MKDRHQQIDSTQIYIILEHQGSLLGTWRTWVILDLIIVLDVGFPTFVQNFRILALLEVCQEPPCHHHWLEDIDGSWPMTLRTWIILDLIIFLYAWFLTCLQSIWILAWLEVCQEPPILDWDLRTLIVYDRSLGGHCHPWQHESPWGTWRKISWNYCIIIFIFGRYKRMCYNGNKNVTHTQTNKQRDSTQI